MIVESIHIRFDEIKKVIETYVANNSSVLVPQRQKASDYENPDPVPQRQDVSSLADADTKDHSLEQVRRNPSRPVQTRRQLATDPEMCMFALTVSIAKPKNIKEAMADSAWIEAMREELHQFDRLQESSLWIEASSKGMVRLTLKVPDIKSFDLTAFSDADHAGCIDSHKSTSGGIQFLADMITKALPKDRFKYLVRRIGMRCLTPAELEVLAKEYA
nr:Gag-Pol polyprotein [Tanacetum cinerariifolium]